MKNMEDEEGKSLMDKALGMLSLDHRAGLVLKEIEGFSYEEIALSLGVPVGTVRSRLHRARLELRAILEKLDKERGDL
jgi:RNA polymerase sigma-70 factor (ECF subfamily)